MNTNSCQPGWASDEIFICNTNYDNGKPPCQAPIAAYATLMGILILLRIWTVIRQFQVWHAREILRRGNHEVPAAGGAVRSTRKRQYPLVVMNSILTVTVMITFIITTCFNVVGCRNGSSGPMLYLFFAPLTLTGLMYGRRIMRLGRTLIPLSKAQLEISPTEETKLMEPDTILSILDVLVKLTWIIEPIALLILVPIFPGNFLPLSAGIATYGIMNLLLPIAWAWQLWRLIIVTSGAQNRDKDGGKINGVIIQLKMNALYLLVAGFLLGLVWILMAAQVFPFAWYIIVIIMSGETSQAFVFTMRFRKSQSSSSKSSSGKSTIDTSTNNVKKSARLQPTVTSPTSKSAGGGMGEMAVVAASSEGT